MGSPIEILPRTALAEVEWDWNEGLYLRRVYFQDTENHIRESLTDGMGWRGGSAENRLFVAKPYSPLAAVATGPGPTRKIFIFYVDEKNILSDHVWVEKGTWAPGTLSSLQIFVDPQSNIAASFTDFPANLVSLYYQAPESDAIYELVYDGSSWTDKGIALRPGTAALGCCLAATAFTMGDAYQKRVYYQDHDDEIREHCFDGSSWADGTSLGPAPTNTAISATSTSGYGLVCVCFQDDAYGILLYKAFPGAGWGAPATIAKAISDSYVALAGQGLISNNLRLYYQGMGNQLLESNYGDPSWWPGPRIPCGALSAPQYFWLVGQNGQALSLNGSNDIATVDLKVDDAQLWAMDQSMVITSKANGQILTAASTTAGSLLTTASTQNAGPDALFLDADGYIYLITDPNLVAEQSTSGSSVSLASKAQSPPPGLQTWIPKPYIPIPDLSFNLLNSMIPCQNFTLTTVLADGMSLEGAGKDQPLDIGHTVFPWVADAGRLVDPKTGYAASVQGANVVLSLASDAQNQQWILTPHGYLYNVAVQLFLSCYIHEDQHLVRMVPYDPTGPPDKIWVVENVDPVPQSKRPRPVAKDGRSMDSTVLHPSDNISSLSAEVRISNDWFSGTADAIYMGFLLVSNVSSRIFVAQNAGAGAKIKVNVDLQEHFGKPLISLSDISGVYFYQDAGGHPIATDDWKLEGVTIMANGKYINDTYKKVNQWIQDMGHPELRVWGGGLSWVWRDVDEKPLDLDLKTYSVRMMPYFGDVLSGRVYDPSTIDGCGILVGFLNGQLIGEEFKSKTCSILAPNTDGNSYTWVYTPDGAVIYRRWDKDHREDYVRHSQLGSGQEVICAGELRIDSSVAFTGVESVIAMANDASGHYKPDGGKCLWSVAKKFQRMGIATDRTKWYWKEK